MLILRFILCSLVYEQVFSNYTAEFLTYDFNELYTLTVNSSIEYIIQFNGTRNFFPARVTVSSEDAHLGAPLMFVARTELSQLSWQLPLMVENSENEKVLFNETSRTLCLEMPEHGKLSGAKNESPIVTVSTSSNRSINFKIILEYEEDFYISPSKPYDITITPSQPRFVLYRFEKKMVLAPDHNYDTVIIHIKSDDEVCMVVSVQAPICPVLDLNQEVTYRGWYETVNTRGGITIPKYKFPNGFYLVLVAQSDDLACTGVPGVSTKNRTKSITIEVKPSIGFTEYENAVLFTLCGIGGFYVVFVLAFFLCSHQTYVPRLMEFVTSSSATTPVGNSSRICDDTEDSTVSNVLAAQVINEFRADFGETISVTSDEYDQGEEIVLSKELRLCKRDLYLSDLAMKDPRVHRKRSYLYLYNVLTIAIFYGLPVVQLVITVQKVLNKTGQQDLCYYNFLCAHPLGWLSDFNHVFSNVGYVLLGILFLFITRRREIMHQDIDFERSYGIPQHYGLFYAMGVSLMMEGILSGSYHVCPNTSNFQFDTSFMYVMAVLCMVKLYQNRHPDINASAYSTFGVLAVAILLGMIGVLEGKLYFWICFTVLHLVTCLYLSASVYYMGIWKIDRGVFLRVYHTNLQDYYAGGILNIFKPNYTARFVILLIGNCFNWCLAFFALFNWQNAFALYLLALFMGNTLLYFFFYIVMKYVHKERMRALTWVFLILSIMCAGPAMYFFLNKSTSSQKTPAESRQFNQACVFLRFYDYHDVWHFLSSIGMFFTFMVLLTLDDDLSHVHRSQIRVF